MKWVDRSLTLGALVALFSCPLAAQTKRDTAFAAKAKVALDSIARDKTAPQYSRRNQTRLRSWVDSLLMGPAKPDSVIVLPPPPDTTTPPPPPPDTGSIATRAELPRAVPTFTIPTSTRVVNVAAGADLQAAINAAQGGDELRLAPGATYQPIVLPSRPCGSWVTITTNTVLPAAGTRVTPTTATQFAKIVTPNNAPAIKTKNPTCGWYIKGVEISATPTAGVVGTSLNYGLVWIGDGGWIGGGENQVSLAQVPNDILIDRVYLHGLTTTNSTRCLYLNAGRSVVRDSWISDCHAVGFDSQAILGCNGPGPTLIENNYLAGATETLLLGGCDPASPDLIPSDWTIRRNHFDKLLSWKGVWSIKNCLEFKNTRRTLVEANVFSPCTWQASQNGMAWVIKSSTETCAACVWEGTKDVTLRYNIVRTAHIGLNIQAIDGSSAGTTASHTERVTVEHNLFTDIGTANGIAPTSGFLMLLTHDLKDIRIRHNTFIGNTPGFGNAMSLAYSVGEAASIDISSNVFAGQQQENGQPGYVGWLSDGFWGTAALNHFASSWSFKGNAVAQVSAGFLAGHPTGNLYYDRVASLGLNADGSLSAQSPAHNRATDGTDPGANVGEVLRRTSGVVVAP